MYEKYFKRAFDIIVATVTLLILLPVFILVALFIKLEDGGPILFVSRRIGRYGDSFRFFKFRSMLVNTPNVPSSQSQQLKITRVGSVIRRTNIDELPQLINILKGDMSLVGPRPPLPIQNELIAYRRSSGALNSRPGLTGLAQVNSYDGMSVEQKAQFDADYVKAVTFLGDLIILLRTFLYLLKPPPIY